MGIRLNRFVSASGICSRRAADQLIQQGRICVNGCIINTLGHRVQPDDVVTYDNRVLACEPFVYLLFNKPKDCVTTAYDPQGRTTVFDVLRYTKHRLYSVGRLDRNTTGLLLLTNDGMLASTLAHPSRGVSKTYRAVLDKPMRSEVCRHIQSGVQLEDGPLRVSNMMVTNPSGREVVVTLHVGRNRVVRRLFEHFMYRVVSLDRIGYAHLTKKGLAYARWRHLTSQEVSELRALSSDVG